MVRRCAVEPSEGCKFPAACLRFDLISIVFPYNWYNCTSPVLRPAGAASSSPIAICTLVSINAIHSLSSASVLPVAHSALAFRGRPLIVVRVQKPSHECLEAGLNGLSLYVSRHEDPSALHARYLVYSLGLLQMPLPVIHRFNTNATRVIT